MVMRFTTPTHNDTWMQPKKVGDRVFHWTTGRQGTVIAVPVHMGVHITVQFDAKQRRGVHGRGGKLDWDVANRKADAFFIGENGLPEE
jgi:hypothetical protein